MYILRVLGIGLLALVAGCSGGEDPNDESTDSADSRATSATTDTDFVMVEKGMEFIRTCMNHTDHHIPIEETTCEISNSEIRGDGRLVVNIWGTNPLIDRVEQVIVVVLNEIQPGVYRSDQPDSDQDTEYVNDPVASVAWASFCNASSRGTPEPCTVELVEAAYDPAAINNDGILEGSKVHLKVSCPLEMRLQGSDNTSIIQQTPQNYEVVATDCTAVDF